MINTYSNLPGLKDTLAKYQEVTKKTAGEVLAKKGKDLGFALYRAFRRLTPAIGLVWEEAEARGWKVRRKGAPGGLSPAALRFADHYMSGQQSILGKQLPREFGGDIRSIRVGKRGRIVRGGRRGRGGRAASYREALSLLASDPRYAGFDASSYGRLNRRAVAVFFELMLRERGRKSLAVAWLPMRKARPVAGQPFRYVSNNPRAEVKWESSAELAYTLDGAEFTIESDAPGMDKYPEAVEEALAEVTADMRTYLDDKLAKANSEVAA